MMEPTPELLEDAAKLWKAMGFVNDRHGSVRHLALCLAVRDEAHAAALSDAEARIAELRQLAQHNLDWGNQAISDMKAAEARAEAAEALLKEAGKVLEPFAAVEVNELYDDGDEVSWPFFYAHQLRAARAIYHKIGVKDE